MAKKPLSRKLTAKQKALRALSDEAQLRMWAQMREEFETTPIGIRELARKFGQRAHTTVLRRQQSEGWRKDPNAISAHIATESVIDHLIGEPGAPPGADAGAPPAPETEKVPEKLEETIKKKAPFQAGALAIADQSGAVRAAGRMAEVQRDQLLREVSAGDQLILAGTTMMDILHSGLTEEDPDHARMILARLRAVGGKEDSFSAMVRAAATLMKEGIAIRRRALSMDGKIGDKPNFGQSTEPSALPAQVRTIMQNLPIEELMKLRSAAAVLNKQIEMQRPASDQVIESVADIILEGEVSQA